MDDGDGGLDLTRREFVQVGSTSLLAMPGGNIDPQIARNSKQEYRFQGVADLLGPKAARPEPNTEFFDNREFYAYRYETSDTGERYFITQDDSDWTDITMTTDNVIDALRQQPTIDLHTFLINKGRGFSVSDRVTDVSNGDSIWLYLDNPQGSGYDYDIVVLPRSTGRADLNISFEATENTAGVDLEAVNLQSGSSREFSGSVRGTTSSIQGDYSHGDTFIEDFVPGSGKGSNVAGEVIDSIAFTIDEGDDKLMELNNISGGQISRLAFNLVIYEVDGTYKELI